MGNILLEENVGGYDLFIRALVGSGAITALSINWVPKQWELLVALIAFVGLFTGITRHCTPYGLIGFSTAKKK